MPLVVPCINPSCRTLLRAKDEWFGKQVRCPTCQQIVDVPAGPTIAEPTADMQASSAVDTALNNPVGDLSVDTPDRPPPSLRIFCPNGHCLNTDAQYIGKQVRCPYCQAIITVPQPTAIVALSTAAGYAAPPPPLPAPESIERERADDGPNLVISEDDSDDEIEKYEVEDEFDELEEVDDEPLRQRKRSRPRKTKRSKRRQFALTNLGLGFHYAKFVSYLMNLLVLLISSILLALVAGSAAAGAAGPEIGGFARFVLVVITGCMIASLLIPLLGIAGSVLCTWTPPRSGALPFIVISLGLDGGAFLMNMAAGLVAGAAAFRGAGGAAGNMFGLLANLFAFSAYLLFLFYLRKLALYLDQDSLSDEAMSIIIHLFIFLGAGVIGIVLLGILAVLVGPVALLFAFVGLLALFIVWVKLAFRILELIGSIRQYIRTRFGA